MYIRDVVVSYWISTSNHNRSFRITLRLQVVSYWISTSNHNSTSHRLSEKLRCILLNFYIKPQLNKLELVANSVVSYWISTSNHNGIDEDHFRSYVVSYWISTSNHNQNERVIWQNTVVSYWISTSNHNSVFHSFWALQVVSYWISTSNHNEYKVDISVQSLYLIEFLHQTTTISAFKLSIR